MITHEILVRGLLGVAGVAFVGPMLGCSSEGEGEGKASAATCPALGAAQKTEPHVLAEEDEEPIFLELTTDSTHVYWMSYDSDDETGQIASVSKQGGERQLLLRYELKWGWTSRWQGRRVLPDAPWCSLGRPKAGR